MAGAVPGDRVDLSATPPVVEPVSKHRTTPPCPLFARCGGCSVQHISDRLYAAWKSDLVATRMAAAGLDASLAPMRRSPLASRRRATFTALRSGGRTLIGFKARRSHNVVDVRDCPALAPELNDALGAIRAFGEAAAQDGEGRLTATLCANGIDVAITRPPAKKRRREPPLDLTDERLVRVSMDGEPLIVRDPPQVAFGGATVTPPPGSFLQATREGERALIELVTAATEGTRHLADLYCGVGTFALPLARFADVLAVETDPHALSALRSARRPAGMRTIATLRRDLLRDPLSPSELKKFDGVVFDPPRAGARPVAQALAESSVPLVVAVSCNPVTLARDCAILTKRGFKITQTTPVDQFVATSHIEVVTVLRRDA